MARGTVYLSLARSQQRCPRRRLSETHGSGPDLLTSPLAAGMVGICRRQPRREGGDLCVQLGQFCVWMVGEPSENLGKKPPGYEPGGPVLLFLRQADPPAMNDPVAGVEQVEYPEELRAGAHLPGIHGVD